MIGIILVSLFSAGTIAFLQIRSILTQVGGEPAVIAELTTKIARGEFSLQSAESGKQETGIFAAVTNMSSQIQSILQEINFLIGAIQDGKLDTRGDAQAFNGGWQELVMGINSVIDAFMGPLIKPQNTLNGSPEVISLIKSRKKLVEILTKSNGI